MFSATETEEVKTPRFIERVIRDVKRMMVGLLFGVALLIAIFSVLFPLVPIPWFDPFTRIVEEVSFMRWMLTILGAAYLLIFLRLGKDKDIESFFKRQDEF